MALNQQLDPSELEKLHCSKDGSELDNKAGDDLLQIKERVGARRAAEDLLLQIKGRVKIEEPGLLLLT